MTTYEKFKCLPLELEYLSTWFQKYKQVESSSKISIVSKDHEE